MTNVSSDKELEAVSDHDDQMTVQSEKVPANQSSHTRKLRSQSIIK